VRENARTRNNNRRNNPPTIRTASPETPWVGESEVGERKKFGELSDVTNIEMGIVKVPRELLDELIHKEPIEKYYTVDEVPVASGLFATVRKCTHRETGVEYAAKYSSRVRGGFDCTTEVLHEIALLSICADSNKIVHLKDVFQNQHEIVLVLEYAPGGDFQSVLDDDMVPFEQDVQGFMLQLLEAVSYIHGRNIAHLDIKPQNIVLMSEFPNCEIKLCDLEVSRVIQEGEEIKEIIGTPDYVAPEILAYEPISLAADIWSLGVLAYVLLTGFSPYGGDTDQETLRNIASATLDFPAELFEGVSEEAKDFIADCLKRKPEQRPTVSECFHHPWIAQHSEPPSPSPLMLKIPAPDPFVPKLSVHSPTGPGSRRSCQTCRDKLNPHHHHPRDKLTERKRYLSKSREAIFEKVANSNLKKSVSKSRERLCDMKSLSLSKSRDYLNESTKQLSRAQEKFSNFKTISKSQEVLSPALGGNMKRMVAGAVSDIPAHNLPINPRVYLDTQADSSDFVMVPGSSVLMSHSELMAISGSKSSGSLQLLPISESKAGSPAPSEPCNDRPGSRGGVPMVATVREEEEEEEVEVAGRRDEASQASFSTPTNLARRRSITETKTFRLKEEKNHINYETQQSMSRGEAKPRLNTAEVAIQVDLSKTAVPEASPSPLPGNQSNSRGATPSPAPTSPPPPPAPLPPAVSMLPGASPTLPTSTNLLKAAATLVSSTIPTEGNIRPSPGTRLARGFSHDDTLGGDEKRYSWREELEKFRASRRPLGGVSHLIDAFSSGASLAGSSSASSSRKSSTVDSFPDLEGVKARRRGSLQIQLDSASIAQLATRGESVPERESASKLQRRKSTSAIPPLRLSEALPNIDEAGGANQPKELKEREVKEDGGSSENKNATTGDRLDPTDKAVSETDASKENGKKKEEKEESRSGNNDEKEVSANGSDPEEGDQSGTSPGGQQLKGRAYLEKVNERKRTWDYFEINHPKAISDKKLEQLKEKYTRRKTEASLLLEKKKEEREVGKSEREGQSEKEGLKNGRKALATTRTMSMPVIETVVGSEQLQKKKSLELAWDPLTGESLLDQDTESVDSGRESDVRRLSTSSTSEESASSRKSSRRKSSHLADILELADRIIPEQCVLECFIDPFTGQFITSEVAKVGNRRSLRVSVCGQVEEEEEGLNNRDEGVGSLPCTTPTTPTTTSTPLTLPTEALNAEEEENGSLTSCCPTDDGICTSGSEGRPGVRGSALSLTSADDAGSE